LTSDEAVARSFQTRNKHGHFRRSLAGRISSAWLPDECLSHEASTNLGVSLQNPQKVGQQCRRSQKQTAITVV